MCVFLCMLCLITEYGGVDTLFPLAVMLVIRNPSTDMKEHNPLGSTGHLESGLKEVD